MRWTATYVKGPPIASRTSAMTIHEMRARFSILTAFPAARTRLATPSTMVTQTSMARHDSGYAHGYAAVDLSVVAAHRHLFGLVAPRGQLEHHPGALDKQLQACDQQRRKRGVRNQRSRPRSGTTSTTRAIRSATASRISLPGQYQGDAYQQ